jgi:hypothetical protein
VTPIRLSGRGSDATITVGIRRRGTMEDFVFVVLTVVLFAIFALVAKAVERL